MKIKLTKMTDIEAMQMAIEVARRGAGFVSPNPPVGCVILNSKNEFLSSGYHQIYGGAHAEVNAVSELTPEELKGSRVFVTLEPCSHYGKTPPCADMLCSAGVGEVIYGIADPNPLVSGKGLQKLASAEIKVIPFSEISKSLDVELDELCEVFLFNQKNQLPFVSLKVATSLDGMLGLKSGESKWITGEESRQFAHFLRATHDVILIGVNTLLTDNPSLNIRHPLFDKKHNTVFILDPFGKALTFLKTSSVIQYHNDKSIFIFVLKDYNKFEGLNNLPFQVVECPKLAIQNFATTHQQFDLQFVVKKAWDLGFKSILVEGGANTLSAFLNQKIGQRFYNFVAPIIIGGGEGRVWSETFIIQKLSQRLGLDNVKYQSLGPDFLITGKLNWSRFSNEKVNFDCYQNYTKTKTSEHFTQVQLYRSPKNGIFLGICQGLGESFNIKPNLLRVLWILSFFYFFVGLGFYLILGISLPNKDKFDKSLNKQVLGVCTIIAKKFNIEIGLVRLLAVLSLIASAGISLLVYLILYFSFEDSKI